LVTLVNGIRMSQGIGLSSQGGKNGIAMTGQGNYTRILLLSAQIGLASYGSAQTVPVPEPPQVRAKNHVVSLTIEAVNENGRDAFAFEGKSVAPVIRASPGDTLRITYVNNLPAKSAETCAVNPCMNMTNLHFHGLTVSPNAPQDDVLGMMAKPGQALH
jgi:FtsP/CotA-like multicopper oxidase with cupredoxin domain